MDFACFSIEATEAADLHSRRASSAPHQGLHTNADSLQNTSLERPLQNPDLQSPHRTSPAPPPLQRPLTNTDLQNNRGLFQSAPPTRPLCSHTDLQSDRGLPFTSKSCGQASKCSYMSYQKRDAMNKLSANLEQQSAHFNIEHQCAHFNSNSFERRNHIDNFSANLEQRIYSHDFSANLEEQSIPFNSSSSSCCQPLKHSGRQGEPLYRSLLRPRRCSPSPFMDYVEGTHHLHHHQCPFEAEASAVGSCLPHQFADFNACSFGSPAVDENNTSMGSVSKGQNYYSFRAMLNEITLYNWYLIRSSGSHASEIAVGGFLSSRGMDSERIETATIVKRLEECKLLTKDGNVVNLMGPIDDYRTVSNGFSLQTVQLFISGFPHIWNLLVGMGLPAKSIGANTSSRSCDLYGGEVTSQVSLQKEIPNHGKCVHQSSDLEDKENELAPCHEIERNYGFKFVTEEGQDVEAVVKVPPSVVLQEQGFTLLSNEFQSNGDQTPSIEQLHAKADKCRSPVRTVVDKATEIARDFVNERSEHEVSNGQMKCNGEQLVEEVDPECEQANMPIEGGEAAVSDSRVENKEPESVAEGPFEDTTQKLNHHDEAFGVAGADANKQSDLHGGAEMDEIFNRNLEFASVHSPEISECYQEMAVAEVNISSQRSLPRKRKVAFNTADDMDMERPLCSLETSKKGSGRAYSLHSKGADFSCVKSMDVEMGMANKSAPAKKKGKRKRKGRFLLPRSKRSTKSMVNDIDKSTKTYSQESEVCIEEGLETDRKRSESMSRSSKSIEEGQSSILSAEQHLSTNKIAEVETSITVLVSEPNLRKKSMARKRKSIEEQSGAISPAEEDFLKHKSAEEEVSISALLSEPITDMGVEIREGIDEKSHVDEAAPRKAVAKKGRGCLTKLRHSIRQSRVHNGSRQPEGDDSSLLPSDSHKGELKIKKNLKVDVRSGKHRGPDFDLHLDTSKQEKRKPLKKMETCDTKDFTCGKESPARHCNIRACEESDSNPLMVASARKRVKMLLPPLPLPLVSISKQLVSKAFGLKTSRSGRLLVPPLAHWRGQSLVRDMDGGIIAIENGSQDITREDTGCFNFKPPMEAKAQKLQKWLCVTATKCLSKKLKARRKHKHKNVSN